MPLRQQTLAATLAPVHDHRDIALDDCGNAGECGCPVFLGSGAEVDGFWGGTEPEEAEGRRSSSDVAEHVVQGCGQGLLPAATTETGTSGQTRHMLPGPASAGGPDLTESDVGNLSAVLDHEVARNTMKNYRTQWRNFVVWAVRRNIPAFPADPAQVAAYLAERIARYGHKPATLRVAAAAIAFVHRATGWANPCASPEVKRTLRGAARKAGRSQKQARALTADGLAAIRSSACAPRLGRGGRLESPQTAETRGRVDVALMGLMRDAMLRVSEAAAVTWRDVTTEPDGTGRLLIRRSKTDPEGQGAVAFLSEPTMRALGLIRRGASECDSVFGLRPNQISTRIKKAAQAAGLGDGFSGHSPRVGMARDLVRAGIELPSLMTAGRWRTPVMPAHYTRNEVASRGAVAQFYGHYRRAA